MSNKDLVADGPRFLLPTEFTVEMGHIEVNGEVGRNVVRDGDDEWITLQIVLLTAAGTAVHGLHDDRLRFRLYAGLQFNLPGQYAFGPHSNLKNDTLRQPHQSDGIGVTQRVDLPRARRVSSAS
jgi:hypothetical protein